MEEDKKNLMKMKKVQKKNLELFRTFFLTQITQTFLKMIKIQRIQLTHETQLRKKR